MRGSSLYQIPLPEGLDSRTYGALYTLLAKRKMIPLGILRGVFANTKSGPKANVMPYVFTNPPKDTELFSCDKVFVLSQTPIKISRFNKDDSKEMAMYSNLRTRKKTAEDVLNVVNALREEVGAHQSRQRELDQRLSEMSEEIDGRFRQLSAILDQTLLANSNVPLPGYLSQAAGNHSPTLRSAGNSRPSSRRPSHAPPPSSELLEGWHGRSPASSPERTSQMRKKFQK